MMLSYNSRSCVGESRYNAVLLDSMPFFGTKHFIPIILQDALFFESNNYDDQIKWWHGWLEGIPFVSGFVKGIRCDFIYSRSNVSLMNAENPKLVAQYWGISEVQFCSISIDIGGEDLIIL